MYDRQITKTRQQSLSRQVIFLQKWNHFSIPFAIMDDHDKLVSYNQAFESLLTGLGKDKNITDYLQVVPNQSDPNLLMAKITGKDYLVIKKQIKQNENLLVGIETSGVTDLLEALNDLKRHKYELEAVFEHSYDGIYLTNREGVTIRTNAAIERITGIPKHYYLGKNVKDLVRRGILKNSVTEEALKKKKTVSFVQKNYIGNITLLTGTPVLDSQGNIDMIVTNIRDLTDLNRIQAEQIDYLKDHEFQTEAPQPKNEYEEKYGIVVQSEQMLAIFETAKRIANFDATILILGETGVGKDVLTNFIYENSDRVKTGKLIKVNCGAIPPELLESELFGYEAGAFTGANRNGKPGMFELANGGTLFLDEVAELPLKLQVKLLRVLQEGEIQRVGGTKPKKVDVHIIAATNRNLYEMVVQGEFREDLYYRLNVIPIHIPPLRERREDILPLIHLFLKTYNQKYQLYKEFDYELIDFLTVYDWPGNIRELSNLIERLVVTVYQDKIGIDHLPKEYRFSEIVGRQTQLSLKEAVEDIERRLLRQAAKKYQNTYEIARALQTSQPTVVRKLKKYNIKVKNE